MRVSETMEAEDLNDLKPNYIIIKIGEETYSTTFKDMLGKDFEIAKLQLANTKGIGEQTNIWIKGTFKETNNHIKIPPKKFELNIYLNKI